MKYFRARNKSKPRILIYTDSRGHEINGFFNKHNPFSSYANYFIRHFHTTAIVCPEKHTTIYDFLAFIDSKRIKYDYIIGHVGVVCFAPRQESQFREVISLKKEKISKLFGTDFFNELSNSEGYEVSYNGERTFSILPEKLLGEVAVRFNKIPNLIWISCNPVLSDWNGNYEKKRPLNTNIVNLKSRTLIQLCPEMKVIDLTSLTEEEVKVFTVDNVHLSEKGMRLIEDKLKEIVSVKNGVN